MADDFTLDDFRTQLDQLEKMGMEDVVRRMPGMAEVIPEGEDPKAALERVRRMIDAMTAEERHDPDRIDAEAGCRIAATSGTQPEEVARLLVQFERIRDLMRRMAKMSLWQRLKLVMGFGKLPGPDDP